MAARTLSRWQKASALVPMTALVVAWGAAVSGSGLATADDTVTAADIPDVPATAFEQPASVQETPAGIDPKAGAEGAVSTLSTNGIPSAALSAYRRAETLLAEADASCNLPWHLVAAIGRVESNHGRFGGNALSSDGETKPGIYGIALDGTNNTARIMDTDNGALDNDKVYDRAVGPMQFIPGTWKAVGVDADGDGEKNPQNIFDAATSAGIYLCSGTGDLSKGGDVATAVKRYNRSDSYVDLVMQISEAYADGDFSQAPNGTSSGSVITSRSFDQTLTPQQRQQATVQREKAEKKAAAAKKKQSDGSSGGSGGGTAPSTGGSGGGTAPSTGGSGGGTAPSTGGSGGGTAPSTGGSGGGTGVLPGSGGSGGSGSGGGGTVGDVVEDTVGGVVGGVTGLLSLDQARTRCIAEVGLRLLNPTKFDQCVAKYT